MDFDPSHDRLREVIKRAQELDTGQYLSDAEITAIAAELGINKMAVARALAEVDSASSGFKTGSTSITEARVVGTAILAAGLNGVFYSVVTKGFGFSLVLDALAVLVPALATLQLVRNLKGGSRWFRFNLANVAMWGLMGLGLLPVSPDWKNVGLCAIAAALGGNLAMWSRDTLSRSSNRRAGLRVDAEAAGSGSQTIESARPERNPPGRFAVAF